MAVAIHVAGLATIKVDTGDANALETLGYTRDGTEITEEARFIDVPGDENGGDEGPPVDVQYLGETARIRLELTKYDSAVAAKVFPRLYGGTDGQPGTAGTLMFGDSKTYRLLIHTIAEPYNYPRAFPRGAVELNKGTRFSTLVLEFEAHKDGNGVLRNATVV